MQNTSFLFFFLLNAAKVETKWLQGMEFINKEHERGEKAERDYRTVLIVVSTKY